MAKVTIKVIPKSKHQSVKNDGFVIRVCLKSQPIEGRANEELIEILAKKFHTPKSSIKIIHGFKGKNKIVDILGKTLGEIEKTLE